MRPSCLIIAVLLASADAALASDRDLLAVPRSLRSRPGASSSGPAGLPAAAPSLPPDYRSDPFAVQTTFKSLTPDQSDRVTPASGGLPTAGKTPREPITPPLPTEPTTLAVVSPSSPTPPLETKDVDALRPARLNNRGGLAGDIVQTAAEGENEPSTSNPQPVTEATPSSSEPVPSHRLSFSSSNEHEGGRPTSFDPLQALARWSPQSESLVTAGSGLALVLGLLLTTVWMLRKAQPRSARPLPREVAELLGRASLGGRNHAQLLRLGNKLVLVSVTPDHTETICEVTDQAEVARLLALCEQTRGSGSSAAFDELFGQMANEPTDAGFLGAGANEYDRQRLAAAYADTPGGRRYA